jgi:hypothetical protein
MVLRFYGFTVLWFYGFVVLLLACKRPSDNLIECFAGAADRSTG